MAKQTLSIISAVRLTSHHASDHKIRIMEHMGQLDADTVGEQFKLIRENCEHIIKKLEEIQKAAEANDCALVLKLLNEESVEAGHDYPPVMVPSSRLF